MVKACITPTGGTVTVIALSACLYMRGMLAPRGYTIVATVAATKYSAMIDTTHAFERNIVMT